MAIHLPDKNGDNRNHHAHIFLTTRQVTKEGLTTKSDLEKEDRALRADGKKTGADQSEDLRAAWALMCNEVLREKGIQIAHRSYARQGIDQVPTAHLGKTASTLERAGVQTERGDINREAARQNEERAQLDRQLAMIDAEIESIRRELDELAKENQAQEQGREENMLQTKQCYKQSIGNKTSLSIFASATSQR